ncbi:hypothetical protein CSHISOI_11033 [Colletotrichum shisoi]|uniref:Uncharacterized protein n=1 Tax=Colletotrichum shisoi TaxID=2078593 RepID=A0A5Q4BD41_9PEZI|nr:hypothetical protein CSHISOI_11033 [Colletotrichum shisoi]
MSTIHSADRLCVGANGTINIPPTYLKYVNQDTWDHPTVRPDKATGSQVDTFIARAVTEWRIEGIYGSDLWDRFILEFDGWTEETFELGSKFMIETLRNHLLRYGVFAEWGRGHGKVSTNLVNTLTQGDYHYWSPEEFDAWHKKDATFKKHCQVPDFVTDITVPPKSGDEVREESIQLHQQSRSNTPSQPHHQHQPPPSYPFHLTNDDNHMASSSRNPPMPEGSFLNQQPRRSSFVRQGRSAPSITIGTSPFVQQQQSTKPLPRERTFDTPLRSPFASPQLPEKTVRPDPPRFEQATTTHRQQQNPAGGHTRGHSPVDRYQQQDQRGPPGGGYNGRDGHRDVPAPIDRPTPKQLADLTKLYLGNNMKYGGEKYDVLDIKLIIFRKNCNNAGISNDANHLTAAFPFMLKGKAYDFYV